MEFVITWGGDPEDVSVVTSGVATVEGLREMSDAVLADPRYESGMFALIDHSQLDWTLMTPAAVRRRAGDLADILARSGGSRIAAVVATPADFGVLRMVQLTSDDVLDTGVFYSRDEARAWLRGASG